MSAAFSITCCAFLLNVNVVIIVAKTKLTIYMFWLKIVNKFYTSTCFLEVRLCMKKNLFWYSTVNHEFVISDIKNHIYVLFFKFWFCWQGWESCEIHDLNKIFFCMLSETERARIEKLDPFDEYEEFNLMCAHYFLLVASKCTKTHSLILDSSLSVPSKNVFNIFWYFNFWLKSEMISFKGIYFFKRKCVYILPMIIPDSFTF